MGRLKTIARRTFLIGSAAIAGGVAIGYWKYKQPYDNPLKGGFGKGQAVLTPYVMIDQTGVTIITPRAEMGQGTYTTLAALVAEELDVDLKDIHTHHGPASHAYYNGVLLEEAIPYPATDQSGMAQRLRDFTHVPAKFIGMQITGGSTSVPDGYEKMRMAGAAAREMLKTAAAQKLGVDVEALKTANGVVIAPDGTQLSYMELAQTAATLKPPKDVELRPKSEWKILGKSQPRIDMVDKCTGRAGFAIDVRLPNMRFATVKMNPHYGGGMNGYDATAARAMKGVEQVIDLGGGVAVVATNTWIAFQAAEAIEFDWGPAPYPVTTEDHFTEVAASFTEDRQNSQNRDDGDVEAALTEAGAEVIEAEYKVPYQAHATMEPMTAAAWLKEGTLEIWAGTQGPTISRREAAKITDMDEENVLIHTQFLGGGFGRRSEVDFIRYAAAVAKTMEGTPVLTTWSREEDMTHDMYRPLAMARFQAALKEGKPHAVDIKVSSPSIMDDLVRRDTAPLNIPEGSPDSTISQAIWDQPYEIEHYRTTAYRASPLLPTGFWRSVGASQNAFFHESMIDELAHATGRDPLDMRLDLITHDPSRKVLEAVAEMSDWATPLPAGRARGIAYCLSFGVPTAEVIEIAQTPDGIRIVKAFVAADVGIALDPRNIEAQLISGVNFGLGAAVSGEITVADGKVEQTNYHDYEPIRMYQSPEITVRILENKPGISGIGEPGTPPAAPALTNAVFALTGQRIRELPLNKYVDFI